MEESFLLTTTEESAPLLGSAGGLEGGGHSWPLSPLDPESLSNLTGGEVVEAPCQVIVKGKSWRC